MDIQYQPGDIILVDSNKTGPRIVKFFMTAPTVWQYIWRALRRTQNHVRFYHVAMVYGQTSLIEQQGRVQIADLAGLSGKKFIVYRHKYLTDFQQRLLIEISKSDVGRGYDVLLTIGKFLVWLTGLEFLTWFIQWSREEICVTRVGYWYWKAVGETFGHMKWHELTTYDMDTFCAQSPHWEVVYES